MQQDQMNSKRIAKNTVYMFFRMFLVMAVGLYTSRVVLATLGVEDYGLYNVVGGVVVDPFTTIILELFTAKKSSLCEKT